MTEGVMQSFVVLFTPPFALLVVKAIPNNLILKVKKYKLATINITSKQNR
ncbi:hypothetical protein ACS7WQ_05115 [Staphylococcus felis]|nr:hypothetical protein [Staphylococcus felis]QQB03340.1 hypothetical protein I6H71_11535 [Staphylococcus felis]